MTRRYFLGTTFAIAATSLAHSNPKPLFNGHDFSGWRRAGHGLWNIEEGTITARFDVAHPGPGYLFTNEEYTDFDLRLEFWISSKGNSGVYIRQPWREFGSTGDDRPAHRPTDGVEVQIAYHDIKNMTGAIYDVKQPALIRGGEERWVHYRIACVGSKVEVWVDGESVNQFEPLRSARGAIGFQMHGQKPHDHVVRFRNIELA